MPGCHANPMAFIVALLCTLVLLLGEFHNGRYHVDEGFTHYLHDRRRDGTVIRTFTGGEKRRGS